MGCRHSSSRALILLNQNNVNSGSRRDNYVTSGTDDDENGHKFGKEECQERAMAADLIYKHLLEKLQHSEEDCGIKNELELRSEFVRKTLKATSSCVECPICFEQYSEAHVPCTLTCGHSFCLDHVKYISACPICRMPIPSTENLDRCISLIDASNTISKLTAALLESESARLLLLSSSKPKIENKNKDIYRHQSDMKNYNKEIHTNEQIFCERYKNKKVGSINRTVLNDQIYQQNLSWEDTISSDDQLPLLTTESDESEKDSQEMYLSSEIDTTNANDSFDQIVANASTELLYQHIHPSVEPPIDVDSMMPFVQPTQRNNNDSISNDNEYTIINERRKRIEKSDDNQQNNTLYTSCVSKNSSEFLPNLANSTNKHCTCIRRYSQNRMTNMNDDDSVVLETNEGESPTLQDELIYIMGNGIRLSIENLAQIHGRVEL